MFKALSRHLIYLSLNTSGRYVSKYCYPQLTYGKLRQTGEVSCSKPYSKSVAQPGLEFKDFLTLSPGLSPAKHLSMCWIPFLFNRTFEHVLRCLNATDSLSYYKKIDLDNKALMLILRIFWVPDKLKTSILTCCFVFDFLLGYLLWPTPRPLMDSISMSLS